MPRCRANRIKYVSRWVTPPCVTHHHSTETQLQVLYLSFRTTAVLACTTMSSSNHTFFLHKCMMLTVACSLWFGHIRAPDSTVTHLLPKSDLIQTLQQFSGFSTFRRLVLEVSFFAFIAAHHVAPHHVASHRIVRFMRVD